MACKQVRNGSEWDIVWACGGAKGTGDYTHVAECTTKSEAKATAARYRAKGRRARIHVEGGWESGLPASYKHVFWVYAR